jgi:pimeloyl-ACP methyl ester carboxylesterase
MYRRVLKAGFRERRFDVGDVELNYVEGPPAGEPLVLIPGQTMPWQSYVRVLPELAERFHVYAVDIRGHGKSGRTPGAYNWHTVGGDMAVFLREVVEEPAIISGNSSGGVLAVWLAGRAREWVHGIVAEDPPMFSSEWPRMRDDCYVWHFLQQVLDAVGDPESRDLGRLFAELDVPVEGNEKVIKLPRLLSGPLSLVVRHAERESPGEPIDIAWLPTQLRVLVLALSGYDPAFSAAFEGGVFAADFDHADALADVRCPMLLLHANWFRHPSLGLVGAMTDDDVLRLRSILPEASYARLCSGHIVHMEQPKMFLEHIIGFADEISPS